MTKQNIIGSAIFISLLFLGGCSSTKSVNKNDISGSVYNIPSRQSVFLDGEIEYVQRQNFIEDTTKGTIDKINVVDNQQVKKGQTLFSYKNEQEIEQYDTLTQQLENLQSTYKQVQQQSLQVQTDSSTNNTKASLQSQLDQNNQQQKSIQKQLDDIKNNRYTTITSPFDGNISFPLSTNTDTTKSILILTNPKMQVAANVSEKDILKLKIGQAVKITVYGTTKEITGSIRSIGDESIQSTSQGGTTETTSSVVSTSVPSTNVSYYPVYIDIDTQDGFYTGFHVQGTTTAENQLIKVPVSAVFNKNSKKYIWLVTNGKLKKVDVDVESLNDTYLQVKSGLTFGDKIISKPTSKMNEGDKINDSTTGN